MSAKTAIITREEFAAAPAFAGTTGSRSLAAMQSKALVPFLKVVQAQKTDTYDDFNAGALVLMPDKIELTTPLVAVPLFFRPSWQKRRDRKDKSGGNNPIVEQSFLPTSDVARRAMSSDLWEEPYPGGGDMKYKYCESLNFVFWIPAHNTASGYSFQIGSHKEGARLCSHLARIRTADGQPVAPHANRLELDIIKTSNPNGESYYVLTFRQAAAPYVDGQTFNDLTSLVQELEDQFTFTTAEEND